MEYERKVEEEARWRNYVEEVERTFGGIGVQTEYDLSRDISNTESRHNSDTLQNEQDNLEDLQGMIETSVLRAAISRRIEEGIASLQKYIHPYNYLKQKERSYPWEIKK